MRAHFQPLTLPENWPQDVPAGVADILKKVMARQPDERYATATELVVALTGLADGRAVASEYPDDSIVLQRATQERDAGNYDTAIDLLTALLSHAPAHEAAHRELMTLYALAGRRHQALRQYKVCAEALETELGASPGPETEALYRQIVGGDVAPVPAVTPKSAWLPPVPIAIEVERSAPLVGRETELEIIRAKINSGWHGRGETILLAGVSGVGTTRLAYESLRGAAQSGVTTLIGAAFEQEGHLAYHPFIEAIDRYLIERHRTPEENPITFYKPMGVTDLQRENTALFKATASFLTRLTTDGPVALLLDDLHAADEASLSMFHYLARHTRSVPLILLATYRTDIAIDGVSAFGSLLNALYREGLSEALQLEPLSQDAGAKIINHTLKGETDPALIKAIYEVAEGNPFFVQEITRAMLKADQLTQEQGQWRLPPGVSMQVPAELRELLRERVQRLGPTVESTLATAAVVGREFRFAVLRSITELPDGELFDALDAALAAQLIEETENGYRFQHSLIRHTLYDAFSRRRRAWLHTRTGQVIEAIYAGRPEGLTPHVEALAYHYDLSDRRDKALPYLRQAARKAVNLFAIEVANDYLERALTLMDELRVNDPAQRWSILEQLGTLAKVLADTSRAVASYEQALALSFPSNLETTPSSDSKRGEEGWQPKPGDRVRLHRSAARSLITAGRGSEAERHLQTAMEVMADTGQASPDYANLLYDVALWHWHNNEHQEAFEAAQRSLDIAEQLNDDAARAQAYEMLALACHSLGEWQQGLNFEQQRSTLIGPNLDVTEAFDAHL
jgi:predicted ATPase